MGHSETEGGRESVLPGTFVDGKFRIEARIATGGMASVHRAEHVHLGRPVAMKVLLARHRAEARRFHQEARLAMSVRHPHVVETFDRGVLPDGLPYIVMELLEGRTLGERLASEGALPTADAVTIGEQTLDALSALHALGIVHRDLKPDNVFLLDGPPDHGPQAKLFDFGIARPLHGPSSVITLEGTTLGTPEYLSPEQARGESVDHRTDLWSAGVLLYECLTGRPPFSAHTLEGLLYAILASAPEPPSSLAPDVPPAVETVVLTALEKRPADRYRSAADMLHALRTAVGAEEPRPATTRR